MPKHYSEKGGLKSDMNYLNMKKGGGHTLADDHAGKGYKGSAYKATPYRKPKMPMKKGKSYT